MLRGIYTSASSMVANQRRLDLISNNMANVNTTGYKKDGAMAASFPEMLISRLDENGATEIGRLGTGVSLEESYTDFSMGEIKKTGGKLDLALQGDGFFVVDTPAGERYTRNGDFSINQVGQVVTAQGYPVLGERGPIQIVPGRRISIDSNGRFHFDQLAGDQLRVVNFAEKQRLEKMGQNLYQTVAGMEANQAENYQVKQGYLEGANVSVISEMVKMIEVNRHFAANQKVIRAYDETLNRTVNDIASLK